MGTNWITKANEWGENESLFRDTWSIGRDEGSCKDGWQQSVLSPPGILFASQLILWRRILAPPLGITQVPRCLESYAVYFTVFDKLVLSWKQVFILLQHLNTRRQKKQK